MQYNFNEIEAKWQKYWADNQTFKAANPGEEGANKPKYYVLDMFPYPSGAGLHVGHPLGYIASDIYARYKRHKGFNVLHPQGYDSFGLPAEQYAIQTGQHPAITTEENIKTYRRQLDQLGFSFDWSREVRTSEPKYYKWTQWIFTQLFNSWYNKDTDKAEEITTLIAHFEKAGTTNVNAVADENAIEFTAEEWANFSDDEKEHVLLLYRLTYLSDTQVNWCPALGTVLANDEIVNGVSERGGHPVERKKMRQWSMRITAYAQRLLNGLEKIDWPEPLKDAQRNWIGRSEGAMIKFPVIITKELPLAQEKEILSPTHSQKKSRGENSSRGNETDQKKWEISVFTTRPDTIFGVSFMTLAPEHELVEKITTPEQKKAVDAYIKATAKRSELDRMADVKTISGVFTGAYAEHPFTKEPIPIWIGDYVLASYGTGAVMAVPCGDQRDYDFAKHFNLPITNIFKDVDISKAAFADKENTIIANSDFLNDLPFKAAIQTILNEIEKQGVGYRKINYRIRDAVFSRQRYWGEPFPIYYVNGLPKMIDEKYLPLELPEVEKYLPTEDGKPPLGNAEIWAWDIEQNKVVKNAQIDHQTVFPLELNTMPGWAGSSQYFNRYMDPHNDKEIFSQEAINYWQDVDLYIGGSEHATGHLLYSRFWQKFMFDRGLVPKDEYAKKLINQGMILGTSAIIYRISGTNKYVSKGLKNKYTVDEIRVDVNLVNSSNELDIEGFRNWRPEYRNAEFIKEQDGTFKVIREVEKMSKSKYNVVNPDAICEQYGADSLRMYEMFLGPLDQAKPWNTAGISGVFSFLKKLWKLYHTGENGNFYVQNTPPLKESQKAFKILHKTIKKVEEDIENFSFNTSISTFMIAVNELNALKCTSREILEPLIILISPFAPHIAEEIWSKLGHKESISKAEFPKFEEKYLVESTKTYPISFNGKMRFTMDLSLDLNKEQIEEAVMAHEKTQAQLKGRTPKKVIIVPGKIVNIVG
ncbi:MAG: leucine--tRNA ligase [Flavobacteriales bacterium]|nr:MAG: leucine--tRNA ligase [Flavobacteriales bacterium]